MHDWEDFNGFTLLGFGGLGSGFLFACFFFFLPEKDTKMESSHAPEKGGGRQSEKNAHHRKLSRW